MRSGIFHFIIQAHFMRWAKKGVVKCDYKNEGKRVQDNMND